MFFPQILIGSIVKMYVMHGIQNHSSHQIASAIRGSAGTGKISWKVMLMAGVLPGSLVPQTSRVGPNLSQSQGDIPNKSLCNKPPVRLLALPLPLFPKILKPNIFGWPFQLCLLPRFASDSFVYPSTNSSVGCQTTSPNLAAQGMSDPWRPPGNGFSRR